jgi:hypothetical protein
MAAVSPPAWYPPIIPTMVPVLVRELKCATHGLPLVPPVNPPQSNRSCVALCRVVQLMQVIGASALAGYPVTL